MAGSKSSDHCKTSPGRLHGEEQGSSLLSSGHPFLPIFPKWGQWPRPGLTLGRFLQESMSMAFRKSPLIPARFHGASAVCQAWGWVPWEMFSLALVAPVTFLGGAFRAGIGEHVILNTRSFYPCCLQVQGVLRSRRNGLETAFVQMTF